jgi:hypothetical protein
VIHISSSQRTKRRVFRSDSSHCLFIFFIWLRVPARSGSTQRTVISTPNSAVAILRCHRRNRRTSLLSPLATLEWWSMRHDKKRRSWPPDLDVHPFLENFQCFRERENERAITLVQGLERQRRKIHVNRGRIRFAFFSEKKSKNGACSCDCHQPYITPSPCCRC